MIERSEVHRRGVGGKPGAEGRICRSLAEAGEGHVGARVRELDLPVASSRGIRRERKRELERAFNSAKPSIHQPTLSPDVPRLLSHLRFSFRTSWHHVQLS